MQKIGDKKNCYFFYNNNEQNENIFILPSTSTHSEKLMGKCDEIKAQDI